MGRRFWLRSLSLLVGALAAGIATLSYGTSNDPQEEGSGVVTTPNERWKDRLDDRALGLIAAICGRSARAVGYDLSGATSAGGWRGVLSHMAGAKAKARTLAKLVFLTLTDRPSASDADRAAPRLLAAE